MSKYHTLTEETQCQDCGRELQAGDQAREISIGLVGGKILRTGEYCHGKRFNRKTPIVGVPNKVLEVIEKPHLEDLVYAPDTTSDILKYVHVRFEELETLILALSDKIDKK